MATVVHVAATVCRRVTWYTSANSILVAIPLVGTRILLLRLLLLLLLLVCGGCMTNTIGWTVMYLLLLVLDRLDTLSCISDALTKFAQI